jgi:hypothetical protein
MKRTIQKQIATAIVASSAGLASAGVVQQTVSFDSGFQGTFINFEQFDTMDGTRELTGLSLSYDQSITLDLTIESNGYTALEAGDWFLDAGYASIHQFGLADGGDGRGGDGNPGPPFIGPGAAFNQITSDLGISDGYNSSGADTIMTSVASGDFTFNANYDSSTEFGNRMFDAFTGPGTLETFLGGFTELFFQWINDPNWVVDPDNPPDGPFDGPFIDPYYGIFVDINDLRHSGAITVTYEYAAVPAPATTGLVLAAGLVGMRRRR